MDGLTFAPGQAPISFATARVGKFNASPGTTPGLTFNSGQPLKFSTSAAQAKSTDIVNSAKDEYAALLKQIAAASTPRPQVYAPKLDFAAINSQARSAAENAVNPFYTKQLTDFLAQQAAQKQQQQTQSETNIKNIEDTLKQTQEANQLTQGRTAEDVAQNQADINLNADQFQTDSGQINDAQRLELARQASTGGLGAQAQENAVTQGNTKEKRQEQQFQQQRQQQELFKSRTFEDLAKSNELAGVSAEKGKKAAKFDLDSYIQNADFTEKQQRNTLEQQRLEAVGGETQNQSRLLINNFINSIADPAQRQAALQAYA